MRNIGLLMVMFFTITSFVNASGNTNVKETKENPKVATTTFLTSAVCEDCKERIEKGLNYTKGVIFAELDMDSKKVTVKYKTKFLDETTVKKVVADLGYDAGDMKRNKEAFDNLPKCCQTPGHCSGDE